jgi:Protein of unknown function (DUF 659)
VPAIKGLAGAAPLPKKKSLTQAPIKSFAASAKQGAAFNRSMAMACITGCVPFTFFENAHFKAAAAGVGVTLPSRKVLSTTLLDSIFKDVQLGTASTLAELSFIDGASDGWRKKHCEQGAGLMNFCALGLAGAFFWDAINCSALRKDGAGIADLLEKQAIAMTDGAPTRFAGWLLDNTKANWAAIKLLNEKYPGWINRGCAAHSFSLTMKDLTSFTPGGAHQPHGQV